MTDRIYVSEEKLIGIKKIIEQLQKKSPLVAVTKKQVQIEMRVRKKNRTPNHKPDHKELKMGYKTLTRVFKVLVEKESLVKRGQGQYWLPEVYANLKENKAKLVDFFVDALDYCYSDEDWKLLDAFLIKMRENKDAKERVECQEYNYALDAEISDEIR